MNKFVTISKIWNYFQGCSNSVQQQGSAFSWLIFLASFYLIYTVGQGHRIKDDRMEYYGVYIGFISKKHCRAAKDCFSRREFVRAADSRLCRSRVAAKIFVFIIQRNFREIINFVFREIFTEFHKILRNSNKCCQNFVFRIIFLEFC